MIRIVAAILVAASLAACAPVQPRAGVTVTPDGTTGVVGASSGRVNAGVTTSGNVAASVDVVQSERTAVSVGTGGVGVSVGNGPVRVGVGVPWWRFGF